MRLHATRLSRSWMIVIGVALAPLLSVSQECRCSKPPGGGVRCSKDQIAVCDPSTGECNCTCRSVTKGKSKDEYISLIFSAALEKSVEPTDLLRPKFQDLTSRFLKSEKEGMFFVEKKTDDGRTVQVGIGVPNWLASELKKESPFLEDKFRPH